MLSILPLKSSHPIESCFALSLVWPNLSIFALRDKIERNRVKRGEISDKSAIRLNGRCFFETVIPIGKFNQLDYFMQFILKCFLSKRIMRSIPAHTEES